MLFTGSRTRAVVAICCLAVFAVACNRKHESSEKATAAKAQAGGDDADAPKVSEIGVGEKLFEKRLLRGFYESSGGWRWTGRKFAVSLDVPQPLAPMYLELDFTLPDEVMREVPAVTLVARVNHQEVARVLYKKAGRYDIRQNVPLKFLKETPVEIEFEIDKSIQDPEHAGRELALIVVGIGLKYYEAPKVGPEREAELSREGYKQLLAQRRLMMPLDKQTELMKLFHDLPVWKHTWFHNIEIDKNPLDLWMMQQIMYEVQPDFVVETGTYKGGSALYWAHTLNGLGLENSRVLTVDISDYRKAAAEHPLWKKYVTFYLGSSTDPAIVAQMMEKVKGRKVIVTLDSDHSMKHVLEELKMYAPMVNHGSYLVVEDTHIDGVPTNPAIGPGPLAAVRKFLEDGGSKDFEQDLTREAYVMTFNPGGWLRRK